MRVPAAAASQSFRAKRNCASSALSPRNQRAASALSAAAEYLFRSPSPKRSATQVNDLRDVLNGSSKTSSYASLTVRVKSPTQVPQVEAAIKNMGFTTFSLLDTTRNLRLFFTVI